MIRATTNALPLETGGILLGYREDGDIVVTDVIVVPSPCATPRRYTRDDIEANIRLRTWFLQHPQDSLTGYVGEWHSHTGLGAVSRVDLSSARAAAKRARGAIALVVCNPRPLNSLDAFVLRRGRLRRVSAKQARIEVR
ncbi:Mov34/MPN/PAD-1 family protein, partial [bacterium]|nr:Mov34/MPN/PAD-1 family protein [bacterium]